MSVTPQHGRRRAETARPSNDAGESRPRNRAASRSARKVGGPAKRMAVVAIAGALLAGGGLAQAATNNANDNLAAASLVSSTTTASATPSAISAPSNIAIDFSHIQVDSTTAATKAATKAPTVKSEADAVTPVAVPKATATPAPTKTAAPVTVDDPAAAQAYASSQLSTKGWGQDQMGCLNQLWTQESSWLTSAENASSGAYGIAQSLPAEKMAVTGTDYRTNYQTQIRWGLQYIADRYGSPCGAWDHEVAIGWY
ncbi:MAG: hypothetical protein WBX27_16670 [Specibacter sp.]